MITQSTLLRNYGITIEIYNKIHSKQNGRCAICNIHQSEILYPFYVDHDHTTGKVRGLLCASCNSQLGVYNDNIINIKNDIKIYKIKLQNAYSAIRYLNNASSCISDKEAKERYTIKMSLNKPIKPRACSKLDKKYKSRFRLCKKI